MAKIGLGVYAMQIRLLHVGLEGLPWRLELQCEQTTTKWACAQVQHPWRQIAGGAVFSFWRMLFVTPSARSPAWGSKPLTVMPACVSICSLIEYMLEYRLIRIDVGAALGAGGVELVLTPIRGVHFEKTRYRIRPRALGRWLMLPEADPCTAGGWARSDLLPARP